MNAKHIIAVVAALSATAGALAQPFVVPEAHSAESLSSTESVADHQRSGTAGSSQVAEHQPHAVQPPSSLRKTREQVRAELAQDRLNRRAGDTNDIYFGD